MVDTRTIIELAPHYVVMLVLVYLTIGILRTILGESILAVELGVALVVVFLYPFAVRQLGYAPSSWE